ncbi:MAG: efflux RND transporter periplasmic adaptor subunit [Myxococcales bacterium]|nr:efflux RND transporter periplasmic adaptor subunit [Myxococcales bacterium]
MLKANRSFLCVGALALAVAGCRAETGGASKAEAAPLRLRYGLAEAARHRPQTEITGSLDPVQSVHLGFDVPGRVERLLVNRGDIVSKGQAIAVLDSRIAVAQADQAAAAVAGAEAQLAAGEAGFDRARRLNEAGAISEQDWSAAQASVLAGRAGVQQARAALAMARANLEHQTLKAPFAGVIQDGPDNAGIMTGGGTPLFLLDDISSLQLKGTAPEDTAGWLHEGLNAVVYSATPGVAVGVPASVLRVLPSLDLATRRLPVEIRVEAPPGTLKAHGFARVVIDGGTDIDAWTVPRAALVARPDFCVFVAGDGVDGAPKRVPVTVLMERDDSIVVSGELTAGAQVVLDPPHTLGE